MLLYCAFYYIYVQQLFLNRKKQTCSSLINDNHCLYFVTKQMKIIAYPTWGNTESRERTTQRSKQLGLFSYLVLLTDWGLGLFRKPYIVTKLTIWICVQRLTSITPCVKQSNKLQKKAKRPMYTFDCVMEQNEIIVKKQRKYTCETAVI